MRSLIAFGIVFLVASCSIHKKTTSTSKAKNSAPATAANAAQEAAKRDSILRSFRQQVKPYASVITKAFTTKKGLFTIHQSKDSIYFEISDSILNRDIMVISRLEKGPGGFGAYAGEELDEKTIIFEKGPNETINMRYDLVISEADSGSAIYKAVVKSNLNPVVYSFPIRAYGKDSASYVIEAEKFLKDKNFVNSLEKSSQLSKQVDDKNLKDLNVESINAYPNNVEVSISKNGTARIAIGGGGPAGPVSLVTHTSFIILPKTPMQRRFYDPRVGYFADYYYPYADDQQKVKTTQFIVRWRLEPKEEDREKWKRGELVEPAKPIVFYIDPATPKQWRKYLILGVNDWQRAFEQAGFKNAIIGKEWPEDDTTMRMDDARYSIIQYFPSEIMNAYGPQVHDPRSGEIIQSRIGWYHNVMQLLHKWYLVQAAAIDPKARTAKLDDETMGQLVRFVSSHEVGHTLGLRHNFGSSSQTPVDSLRSKTWLRKHGHTASIMDYARFNYVAQPEDKLEREDLFPRIGEYDRWAIEWGYKNIGAADAYEDQKLMNERLTDSLAHNALLWFGDGETKKGVDPRCQTEDLGDNAVKASTYGIKNLQRIVPALPVWTYEKGGVYEGLTGMYSSVKEQYFRYITHVQQYINGVFLTVRSEETKKDVYAPVPRAMQEEALAFFNTQLFNTPYWLLNKQVINKTDEPSQADFVEDLQVRLLNSLLDMKTFGRLLAHTRRFGDDKTLPVDEYIAIIHKGIWAELRSPAVCVGDPYRRTLQKSYVGALMEILISNIPEMTENDAFSAIRADMLQLYHEIGEALPRIKDNASRYHLQDLSERIKKWVMSSRTPGM